MRDLYSHINPAVAIGAAVLAADNTPAAVDLTGFESAVLEFSIGAGGITFTTSNKIEFVVTHSDDDISYSNVVDADVQGVTGITGGIVKSLVAAHATADVTRIGYIGNKKYLKVLADFSGTHGTGTPIAVSIIKGNPQITQD